MLVLFCRYFVAISLAEHFSFLSMSDIPSVDQSSDWSRHRCKRETPAPPQEDVVYQDNKSELRQFVSKGSTAIKLYSEILYWSGRRFSIVGNLFFTKELHAIVSVQSDDSR
jgi:hypothetical protein